MSEIFNFVSDVASSSTRCNLQFKCFCVVVACWSLYDNCILFGKERRENSERKDCMLRDHNSKLFHRSWLQSNLVFFFSGWKLRLRNLHHYAASNIWCTFVSEVYCWVMNTFAWVLCAKLVGKFYCNDNWSVVRRVSSTEARGVSLPLLRTLLWQRMKIPSTWEDDNETFLSQMLKEELLKWT